MRDQPDVGQVDPHPERVGGDEHARAAGLERMLRALARERGAAGVVVARGDPRRAQIRRDALGDLARAAVDDRTPGASPFECGVQIRYRGDVVPAVVEALADATRIRVEFRSPQRAVAPGQSAVVYVGDELMGGGRIIEAIR